MWVARLILGVVLVGMAAGQVADPGEFVRIMTGYQAVPSWAAPLLAGTLVAGEVAGGTLLLAPGLAHRRVGAHVATLVALVWSALAIQAFARHIALDNCGCFGVYLRQELRWWILLEDAEFVLVALWVRHRLGPSTGTHVRTSNADARAGSG